jgi:hypothetical protein
MNANAPANPKQLSALLRQREYPALESKHSTAGVRERIHFLRTHLEPLRLSGWIERTIPDKPRSSKQKYRLTEKGRRLLGGAGGQDE